METGLYALYVPTGGEKGDEDGDEADKTRDLGSNKHDKDTSSNRRDKRRGGGRDRENQPVPVCL